MTKAEMFYSKMRNEAKRGYEESGNWDWTIISHWGEDETKNVIKDVEKLVKRQRKNLALSKKIGLMTEEGFSIKNGINEQVQKFVNERKRILGI